MGSLGGTFVISVGIALAPVAVAVAQQAPRLDSGAVVRLEALKDPNSLRVGSLARFEIGTGEHVRPGHIVRIEGAIVGLSGDTAWVRAVGRSAPDTVPLWTAKVIEAWRPQARYAGVRGDTLLVTLDQDTVLTGVPFALVTRLDVFQGYRKKPYAIVSTLGGLAGAYLGATALYGASHPCKRPLDPGEAWFGCFNPSRGLAAVFGGAFGAALGAAAGSVALMLVPTERWSRVPLGQLRPAAVALPGGRVGLGASLRR